MLKLNKATEKTITADWLSDLPSFVQYAPRWIVRRFGPVVQGLLLERDSSGDVYWPVSHVHSLLNEMPFITLTLYRRLTTKRTGGPDWIKLKNHKHTFQQVLGEFETHSLLSLRADLSLSNVLDAYRRDNEAPQLFNQYNDLQWEDEIRLLVWAGESEVASHVCERYCKALSTWPEYVVTKLGGLQHRQVAARNILNTRDKMSRGVISQVSMLKLHAVPDRELR